MNLIHWLGIGTVAATKNTNTREIMVHLPNEAPLADGRSVANVEQKQETSLNANGEQETSTTMVSNTIPAIWNSFGEPNRKTAPDVKEGTQVSLYKTPGSNITYWTTFGFSAETLRLETIIWGFSANPNIDENAEFSVDDYFTVTVDTRTGFMAVRTSQANKEKSGLELRIDGANGRVDINGSNKSVLCFNDHLSALTYMNKEGLQIAVDKKKLDITAPDSIGLFAEESINVLTKVLNVQCTDVNVKANSAKVAIPLTQWEGDIQLEGDITQKGDIEQTGDLKQSGNTTSTGIVRGLTDVQTATISLNTHVHAGVQNGNGTTAPPVG